MRDKSASCWDDAPGFDQRIGSADIGIRDITDLKTKSKVLVRNIYFEGGDVLRCYEGRFRFVIDEDRTIDIGPGEVLCIYPEHWVTIEALEKTNRLVYCILNGPGVVEYFNSLGYYDGLKGRCSPQFESVQEMMRLLNSEVYVTPEGKHKCLRYLSDALVTVVRDIRRNGNALVIDAIRQIRTNLKNRIVRIDPLCEQLRVSHAYLHRIFVNAGVGTPSDFIRKEQLRVAVKMLRETTTSVSEVAEEAGFISSTHFANFIKRYTGKTAREIRRGL